MRSARQSLTPYAAQMGYTYVDPQCVSVSITISASWDSTAPLEDAFSIAAASPTGHKLS
jgi:hypothetical protein